MVVRALSRGHRARVVALCHRQVLHSSRKAMEASRAGSLAAQAGGAGAEGRVPLDAKESRSWRSGCCPEGSAPEPIGGEMD